MTKLSLTFKRWRLINSGTIQKLELLGYAIAILFIILYLSYYIYLGSWPYRDQVTRPIPTL